MTFQQLEYVLALDNHRHFVKAAESCFVSQPTLTLQLQKLEEETGIKIFDRSITPFKPTEIGYEFILRAKNIISQVSQLKDIVKSKKNEDRGVLKLGIIPSLSPYLLPLFINSFLKKHPKLFLEIEELESEMIIKKFKEGNLDIAIMVTPLNENFLNEVFLFKEPFSVYVNPDHKLASKEKIDTSDLDQDGLWLLKEGHCFRNQVLELCSQTKKRKSSNFSFEANSIETLKNLIQKNSGYTLIPDLTIEKRDEPFIRKFKSNHIPSREVSIVSNEYFPKTMILDSLRQEILSVIPEDYIKNDYFIRVDWR